MRVEEIDQLTIFDLLGEPFDKDKASYTKRCDGDYGCLVKAYIPSYVIFPDDENYDPNYSADDPWLQYIAGMYRACGTFKLPIEPSFARDNEIPVELLILRGASFRPEYVIGYL